MAAFLIGVLFAFMPGLSLMLKQPPVKLEDVDPMHQLNNAGFAGRMTTMMSGPKYVDPHSHPAARNTSMAMAKPLL